jgi:lysophospholipase L1-like esterase
MKTLQLTGLASYASPDTFGVGVQRGQVIKVHDALSVTLLALTAQQPSGPNVPLFTLYAGGLPVSYDFTDEAVPITQRAPVRIDPLALPLRAQPLPRGTQLFDNTGIPYGYADGAGGVTASPGTSAPAAGWEGSGAPPSGLHTGATIPAAQTSKGVGGLTNRTQNASRVYQYHGRTAWVGRVFGSAASLAYGMDGGYTAGVAQLSVDGAATADVSLAAGVLPVLSGASDAWHNVVVKAKMGYGTQGWLPVAGTGLSIEGSAPAVEVPQHWLSVGDIGGYGVSPTKLSAHGYAGFHPALQGAGWSSTVQGSNTPSLRFRADCTGFWVLSHSRFAVVCVDGGAPVVHSVADSSGPIGIYIPCEAGAKDYSVAAGGSNMTAGFSVGVVGEVLPVICRGVLDQFGDSITEGNVAVWGAVETFGVAAALDRAGQTYGVSGNSVAQCLARMQALLPAGSKKQTDVAVLQVGVNEAGTGWTGQVAIDYAACIAVAVQAGYGLVLCRLMLPNTGNYVAVDGGIIAAASAAALLYPNKVRWVDTRAWPYFANPANGNGGDGLHLGAADYANLVPYCAEAYAAAGA